MLAYSMQADEVDASHGVDSGMDANVGWVRSTDFTGEAGTLGASLTYVVGRFGYVACHHNAVQVFATGHLKTSNFFPTVVH